MKSCREYTHFAYQCIDMAKRVDRETRSNLLRMAEVWLDHALVAARGSGLDETTRLEVLH